MERLRYKKLKKAFAFAAAGITALSLGAAVAGFACSLTANAEYVAITSASSSLIIPQDYSQYLNLSSPSACAVSSGYIAIADSNKIYVYNKLTRTYGEYTHGYNGDPSLNNVAQIDFCADGYLYFTDASTYLYKLDMDGLTSSRTGITCSTFTCSNYTIYFATIVNGRVTIASAGSDNPDMSAVSVIYTLNTYSSPSVCCDSGGNLYFTDGIYLYDNTASAIVNLPLEGSVTASVYLDGVFYFCDSTGRLSLYNYAAATVESYYDGAYCSLDFYDGSLYTVNAASVEQYSCSDGAFTDYRICSASSAVGRLNGACDAALVDNTLLIAESGNARVTVYDGDDNSFSVFYPEFVPENIAADSLTVLVSGEQDIGIYNYSGEVKYTYSDFARGEELRGATNVYGTYYLVTSGNTFVKIYKENGTYTAAKISKQLSGVCDSLSSDVYGNLIVKTTDGAVYTFSEDAFMSAVDSGSLEYTFPSSVNGFFSDYRGDVFGISGSSLISDCGTTVSISSAGCVYQADESPVKVAACFERRGGYIVYENYVVYAPSLGVPTLNDIPTESSGSEVFASGAAELRAVNIKKNAVEIFFDFSEYEGATTFPYSTHERISEDEKAVVMAETSIYYVVGVVSESTNKYKTGIVLKSSCEELDSSLLQYSLTEYDTCGYTTNDIPLYRYACFASEVAQLKKGAEAIIFYAIDLGNGFDFCKVGYSYNGIYYEGYLPKAYLIPTDETDEQTTTVSYAYIDVEDEYYTMVAADGTTLKVSTDSKFTVIGDPYSEDEVTLSYTEENKTYYTTVDSTILKSTNTAQIRIFAIILIGAVILLVVVNYAIFCKRHPED